MYVLCLRMTTAGSPTNDIALGLFRAYRLDVVFARPLRTTQDA